MKLYWDKLLSKQTKRVREIEKKENIKNKIKIDYRSKFDQDYDRIIFNPAFRRLQDKAQVFPLESNDFVRTRLTHSLEVSSISRSIGISLEKLLIDKIKKEYKDYEIGIIPTIIASAGLIHDLGNTPFGHAGEKAIQNVFKKFFEKNKDIISEDKQKDFLNFDGNPQTFRILTYLESIKDLFGLNLTYATLASSIKYPVDSTKGNNCKFKKFGYFQSEKDFAEDVLKATSLLNSETGEACRHPLVLLLEAADDIAYSVGDIEDGFKKGIFTLDYILELDFIKELDEIKRIENNKKKYYTDDKIIMDIRINIQGKMIRDVLNVFINKYHSIMNGEYNGELLNDSESRKIREKLYEISKDKIFSNPQIYEVEFSGVKALEFLANMFLEEFSKKEFIHNIYNKIKYNENELEKNKLKKDKKSHENKIYNIIAKSYRKIYEEKLKYIIEKRDEKIDFYDIENELYYNSFLLITDYISGMTDSYCINLYRKLNAIDIYRNII